MNELVSDEDGESEVNLIDITFDEKRDSKGISFCNSRIVLKDKNLLDKEVCPDPIVQKSSAYTYVHQVTSLSSETLNHIFFMQSAPITRETIGFDIAKTHLIGFKE